MIKRDKKRKSFLASVFSGMLFGSRNEKYLSPLEEEAMQSPFRTIVKNFLSNRISLIGIFVLVFIILSCFVLSSVFPLDLTYYDLSQSNVAPGFGITSYPGQLNGNVTAISAGSTFGVAIDGNGMPVLWNGLSDPNGNRKLQAIPESARDLKMISAGLDHVLAITKDNKVVTWGNNRLKLDRVPRELAEGEVPIRQIVAASQYSLALSEDGYLYFWGNSNLVGIEQDTIKKAYQYHIAKVAATLNNILLLMDDGSVNVIGMQNTVFFRIPEGLPALTDLAVTDTELAAAGIDADGKVYIWGNNMYGIMEIPKEVQGHAVKIVAGRYHFTVLTDRGELFSWGRNTFNQASAPSVTGVTDVFAGYLQNYAIGKDGKIITWGLKGYLMGTDDQGRDVFRRLLSGGRLTLTVGAVSVLIALVIGVIVGGVAGYYGGRKIDNFLMRMAEVVGSIPFLPLAMTLSALIGSTIGETGRIIMIMVILGVLSWPPLARLIRGQFLAEREKEFVTAAKALGIKEHVIIFRHILPNVIGVVIVNVTLRFATSLLTESSLSFLGFGVVPPNPTWGNMLTGSQTSVVIRDYWWRWVFPAVALAISTISINTIGDGLRDAIDPKSNER